MVADRMIQRRAMRRPLTASQGFARLGLTGLLAAGLTALATTLHAGFVMPERSDQQRDADEIARVAQRYVTAALADPAMTRRYVTPHAGAASVADTLDGATRLAIACDLLIDGDRRYHRYLSIIQARVSLQARGQAMPQRMADELEALRAPPMAPKHLVRSQAFVAACESSGAGASV